MRASLQPDLGMLGAANNTGAEMLRVRTHRRSVADISLGPRDSAHSLKCDLAGEVLRSFGSLRLQVRGWSMLPAIWPGDILELERAKAADLSKGEIVLFCRDRRLFAHRVLKSSGSAVLTCGDTLPYADPVVPEDELLGRVAAVVRDGKCFKPGERLSASQRAVAGLARSSDFATRVIVRIRGLLQRKKESILK
jgi:signal peptidase I